MYGCYYMWNVWCDTEMPFLKLVNVSDVGNSKLMFSTIESGAIPIVILYIYMLW